MNIRTVYRTYKNPAVGYIFLIGETIFFYMEWGAAYVRNQTVRLFKGNYFNMIAR